MRTSIAALSALLTLIAVVPAHAQNPPPPCEGDLAIVRVSQLKPTGSLQGFMKAQDPGAMQTDAEWDAYVKMYRDQSDIKSDYMVCLPKKK